MRRISLPFSLAAAALACTAVLAAGEPVDRQSEILRGLATFGPPGTGGGFPWMLDVWDSDSGLRGLIEFPDNQENAAANFRRMEELYLSEKAELDKGGADTAGVRELLAAADKGMCRLSPDFYPEFDRVSAKLPDFLILRTYLKALDALADRLEKSGDRNGAERCHQAMLLCGRHLTGDKTSALVYMTGLIFKLRGAQSYERFLRRAGRPEAADQARRFAESMEELLRFFNWKANVALNLADGFDCVPAMAKVAAEDREPCWRKEALVRLAILRHGVVKPNEKTLLRSPVWENAADAALARAAESDPEPSVRRLAAWAVGNVKPENYEALEHKF